MRRNFYFSFVGQGLSALSSIAAIVVVSRYLTPGQVGAFTVAMAIFAIVSMIQAAGIGTYVLYAESADEDLQRRVLAVGLLTTLLSCLLLCLIAFFASDGEWPDGIRWILILLTAKLLALAPTLVPQVMLAREERYGLLSMASLAGGTATSLTQIALVMSGWSVLGLVLGEIMGGVLMSGFLIVAAKRYVILRPRFRDLGPILRYSWSVTLGSMSSFGMHLAPSIMLGALVGLRGAGLYSRANLPGQLYFQAVGRAIEPVIRSSIARRGREGEDIGVVAAEFLRNIAPLSAAFCALCALISYVLVPFVLGAGWMEAAPVMVILCLGLFFVPLTNSTAPALLHVAPPARLTNVRLAGLAVQVALVVACAPYGLLAASAAIAAANAALFVLQSIVLSRALKVNAWSLFRPVAGSVLLASPAIAATYLMITYVAADMREPIVALAAASLTMGIVMIISLAVTRHPLLAELVHPLKVVIGMICRRTPRV